MVLRAHVLTRSFRWNSRGFLFPLVVARQELLDEGVDVRIFTSRSPTLVDCDILILDSKFFRDSWDPDSRDRTLVEFADLRERVGRLLFFDTSDSSGALVTEVLPHVDAYFKNQLLRARNRYQHSMYGGRPYTDYYNHVLGIEDVVTVGPATVEDPSLLEKLHVGWNSGIANYSLFGQVLMAAYRISGLRSLLVRPRRFVPPSRKRPLAVSARMGLGHAQRTVGYQRHRIHEALGADTSVKKVGRLRYLKELERAQVVVSPFGWGEITIKDYEVFLSGALLLKPDMSHLETWPEFFVDGETMVSFSWIVDDLPEVIEGILASPERRVEIALEGQRRYRYYTAEDEGRVAFAQRVRSLIETVTA